MAFTSGNIAGFNAALKNAAGALLAPQQVDLYDGATVTVKLHVSTRRANESDLTGGVQQDTQLIATIDYDDWIAKAGREPHKGDVIWWLGTRHVIDRSIAAAPAGDGAFFKARLRG